MTNKLKQPDYSSEPEWLLPAEDTLRYPEKLKQKRGALPSSTRVPEPGARWYAIGAMFLPLGVLVALLLDRGVGTRVVKAGIGGVVAFVLIFGINFFAEHEKIARQQRNFKALCANPNLTCIETDIGWEFQGKASLLEQVCKTKNTGIECYDD